MIKLKCVWAYILSILLFALGITLGIIWVWLYGGYQDADIIDISTVLAEKIAPALLAVYFSSKGFGWAFPNINSKYVCTIINFCLMIVFFSTTISRNILRSNYLNFIYTLSGLISSIGFMIFYINKNKGAVSSDGIK